MDRLYAFAGAESITKLYLDDKILPYHPCRSAWAPCTPRTHPREPARMIKCEAHYPKDMQKDFDRWNEKKKTLNEVTFRDYVHEREVWWCALGVNVGVEADGKHDNFERPVLVIRKFNTDAVLVVPLTSRVKKNPYHAPFRHDGETFSAVVSQIRLVSTKRLLRRLYRMDSSIFDRIQSTMLLAIQNRPPLSWGPRGPHGH